MNFNLYDKKLMLSSIDGVSGKIMMIICLGIYDGLFPPILEHILNINDCAFADS